MQALSEKLKKGNDRADLPGVALGTADEKSSTPTAARVVSDSLKKPEISPKKVATETTAAVESEAEPHRQATMQALSKELKEGNDQADLPGVTLGEPESEPHQLGEDDEDSPETTAPKNEMAAERERLVAAMVEKNLISKEFSESGALEAFEMNQASGVDAMRHILIGDETGGAHHLATILDLEIEGRQISAPIANPDKPNKGLDKYRKEQEMRPNGVYRAKGVLITDSAGQVFNKEGGSHFFPDSWTAQDVLEAAITVSKMPPSEHHPDFRSYTHKGEVKGVKVSVHVDDMTGKIRAAFPRR